MFTISKEFAFSASHQLRGLPLEHPCSRLHGHNYVVTLVLAAEKLDRRSFVVDYNDLAPFEQYLKEKLDHRHLNDVLHFPPTAEKLAQHLFEFAESLWPDVVSSVFVSETPKTWANYAKDHDDECDQD